ncbi:MAG TPA: nucleotidyltransferase domain-containing protein [Candidatus Limnocylindrales bacterium]|nr:nucleotidyltransferase domain-containing protein [Candidatus Limnocylindrales bacterium]
MQNIRKPVGDRLKQVILFGSRARGDHAPDSDYDCLVVLDEVSPEVKNSIDEIAGEFLYRYNKADRGL